MFLSLPLSYSKPDNFLEVKCYFIPYDLKIASIELNIPFYTFINVAALRNKISKLLNIPRESFYIGKLDEYGHLSYLLRGDESLKKLNESCKHKNEIPFFIFQIDPIVFFSPENVNFDKLKEEDYIRESNTIFKNLNENEEIGRAHL